MMKKVKAGLPASAHEYLEAKGIPSWMTERLEKKGILRVVEGGMAFVNPQKDFCEVQRTDGSHACRKASPNRFWYVLNEKGNVPPRWAFICETAVDAISLMLLRDQAGGSEPEVFISTGGVGNQETIDRIKKRMRTVIAVNNNDAGESCRSINKTDCPFPIIPVRRDWNEDLRAGDVDGAFH